MKCLDGAGDFTLAPPPITHLSLRVQNTCVKTFAYLINY